MKKKHLVEALENFNDDDHLIIGEDICSFVPEIRVVCGRGQRYMAYYCVKPPNHEGECYCAIKDIDFIPD
jgi:hypothetical protein